MLVDFRFGLHSLGAMARALSVSMSLNTLLECAAEEALHALKAASVSIGRLEHGERTLRTLINVGELAVGEARWPEDETYSLDRWGRLGRVLNDGLTRTDQLGAVDCDPKEAELLRSLDKGSSLTALIRVDGTVWGEFFATRRVGEPPFAEGAVSYVDVLVAILGAAISRSLREATLEHLAFHDALTGALNRRGWDQAAAQVFELPESTSRVVTIIALDINCLKQVNDQQGHARGDELIETVAQALHRAFAPYPGSLVARIGGDEFTVLVPHHDPAQLVKTATMLCESADKGWTFGPMAGISAGAASALLTGQGDVTLVELLTAADQALYAAKRQQFSTVVASQEYALNHRGGRRADDLLQK